MLSAVLTVRTYCRVLCYRKFNMAIDKPKVYFIHVSQYQNVIVKLQQQTPHAFKTLADAMEH